MQPGTDSAVCEPTRSPIGFLELQRQETLLKTGALQDAIFNSAYFSCIATDEKGVVQIFNVGAERMLGYAALDVVNLVTPADISDSQELVARAAALSLELDTPISPGFEALVFKASRGIEDIYELTYIRKDGSRFPAIVSVTSLRDAEGRIIGYLLIGTDNTARKQAEAALLKAGALQSAIFNSANFSSIATDANGVIQIFNVGAERMLGYAAADVMNRITPADISDPQELIARAEALSIELATPITPGFEALVFKASRGIEDIYELTYIRKDGSRFPALVSVTALRDAQENIIGYLLIGTDNTVRKEVEAARAMLDQRLRDQQFYTRSLIESNIDALMTTDPRGIISDVNQQMMALTGRTRDELIGAPCNNFFTDPKLADAAIKRVLIEHKLNDYELTVRAQNGQETVVSYNAATFHDRDRKLQGVFAAARDVTERKRTERILEEKNIELVHASRMKSEFLATMSHELRTPLNAIIGFSEALKDGVMGPMSEVQTEYIGDIFSSGQHLLSLINDILDLSKVEAGMMALELEPVDLASLLANSLTIVREKAVAQRIQLELEAGDDLGTQLLDQRKTKQIVYNLLSNAVKFSASGGRVTLRAERVARTAVGKVCGSWPVHAFALPDNSYSEFVQISVIDNGIGISELNMTRLFQAFSQIDSSLARRFEGTGLGLAMVKQLAQLHGGTVAVASAEAEGACFAVWLPLQMQLPAADSLPKPGGVLADVAAQLERAETRFVRQSINKQSYTVLVVDDDPKALKVIAAFLPPPTYTVVPAASGREAIALAQQLHPDLILLDLAMPDVSGADVIEALQRSADTACIPILVVTATQVTSWERATLNSHHGNDIQVIEKAGFNPAQFVEEVRRVLHPG